MFVQLSLFNVADPEKPQEEAVLVLGDSGTNTEVSYEHKAFLYHESSGVIVLPIDLHQVEKCKTRTEGGACPGTDESWAPSTFQGAYVLYLEGSAAGGDTKRFRVHGRITHEHLAGERNNAADTGRVMIGLWGGNWRASLRRVYRSIYMDGLLYTLSDRHMQAHLLSTMAEKAVLNWTMPVCYPAQVYADSGNFNPWPRTGMPIAMP
jgi:inhibitor of cysteine peptidase